MRTPAFWYRPAGALARLLSPLGTFYGLSVRRRLERTEPVWTPIPVICIGNLVAGGAGKTPVALAVAEALAQRGRKPGFLTRGHGGRIRDPHRVDPDRDSAMVVGDEPLLLASQAPCIVSPDRVRGVAALDGVDVVVMDDGHQNPALVKDLSLIVVDGAVGFGNGRLIPAGPLREPTERGLARADAVVILGEDRAGITALTASLPVLRARLCPDVGAAAWQAHPVVAFAGIGRPEKFFDTIRSTGATLAATVAFADHHPYTERELVSLSRRAESSGAVLLTTAKDAVRLPPAWRGRVEVLAVRCVWDEPRRLESLLDRLRPAERS